MPCKCARYDAAGHKILPHDAMKLYYKDDPISLDLVKRNMPFRLVVIPDILIRIDVQDCTSVQVLYIYPGETKERTFVLSEHGIQGLRNTWRGRKGWEREKKVGYIALRRAGRVILDPKRRYGLWQKMSA